MNRHLFSLLLAVGLLAAAASPAPASGPDIAARMNDRFDQMDVNGDGKVSWEEFSAFFPSMRPAAFEAVDRSGDKMIDRQEWLDFSTGHSREMQPTESMGQGGLGQGGMAGALPADMPPAMREALERKASGQPGPGAVKNRDSDGASPDRPAGPGALLPGMKGQN